MVFLRTGNANRPNQGCTPRVNRPGEKSCRLQPSRNRQATSAPQQKHLCSDITEHSHNDLSMLVLVRSILLSKTLPVEAYV
eukprot:3895829-Amphidinium_carterae.2